MGWKSFTSNKKRIICEHVSAYINKRNAVNEVYKKKNHARKPLPFSFLVQWRDLPVYELCSYVLMFASIPMIAYGIQPYTYSIMRIIVFTVLTMYAGFFAVLIWNDINDAEIDAIAHPTRPLPAGRIDLRRFFGIALICSALTFMFALLISVWCLFLVGAAALFVTFHNKYLKRKITFPAYSEVFGPLQWIVIALFGFVAIWTALPQDTEIIVTLPLVGTLSTSISAIQVTILLIIFIYFADSAHDLVEGVHDAKADRLHGVKTYATTFGGKKAVRISFTMFVCSGIAGTLLFFTSALSLLSVSYTHLRAHET